MARPEGSALIETHVLPEIAYGRSKAPFDPRLDVWDWHDGAHHLHIEFDGLPASFADLKDALKYTLMVFAKGYSSSYVQNLFGVFLHFARIVHAPENGRITHRHVGDYRTALAKSETWRLTTLSPLLRKWFALGLGGVAEDAVAYFSRRRIKGNTKGAAVRTRDPVNGPFSDAEFRAIFRNAGEAYDAGNIPRWPLVLVRLLAACGGRISQYASMKVMDFSFSDRQVHLPQIKNREEHARSTFLTFDLSTGACELLHEHVTSILAAGGTNDTAMFPLSMISEGSQAEDSRPEGDLFYGHPTGKSLSRHFKTILAPFAPTSERVDFSEISLTPRRFRYTFGTRLAEEGASKALIADRLGHADLQNVDVYFEASPAIVENIDRAMGAGLAPIAQAFRGTLISGEEQSSLKGAAGTRIIDFRASTRGLGSCGKGGKCNRRKPVACYTCFKFEPWLDGPHEATLIMLKAERAGISDPRIAEVNDDAITAVEEVIAECRWIQGQRSMGSE